MGIVGSPAAPASLGLNLTKGAIVSTKIFINLPVKDLDKSMDFFKALG